MTKKECKCPCTKIHPYLYFIGRILIGIMFMIHGLQKFGIIGDGNVAGFAGMMGLPISIAFLVATIELVGGLFIALGLFTRYSALAGAIVMIAAYVMAHAPKGLNPLANGGELALVYLAAFLIFHAKGNGILSLEKTLLKKEC